MHFERHFAFKFIKLYIFFSRKPEQIIGFTSKFMVGFPLTQVCFIWPNHAINKSTSYIYFLVIFLDFLSFKYQLPMQKHTKCMVGYSKEPS